MTNVTNIFNKLSNPTGNFLIFSEYTNALSRASIDPSYKIRPSKFVCLDLGGDGDIQKFDGTLVEPLSDYNITIPRWFQNCFEAGIAGLKNKENTKISPQQFSIAFWAQMARIYDGVGDLAGALKYVGDISTLSWKDGFADIILDITSGSKGQVFERINDIPEDIDNYLTACGNTTFTNPDGYISGWTASDHIPLSPEAEPTDYICYYTGDSNIYNEASSILTQTFSSNDSSDPSFTFNAILVLFDITDGEDNPIYHGIPMGIYFTGIIDENFNITNPVTIYSSDQDAYGAGSGWSLRICTRFTPTPIGTVQIDEVALESQSISESISALLAANAETLKNINEFSQKQWVNSQSYRDLLGLFKNGRTNVPYIKTINGEKRWFVNGKDTGVTAAFPDEATTEEIDDIINE